MKGEKMTTIYINKKNKQMMEDLRIALIVKNKKDVKKAELFDRVIQEGIKKIKEKEGV